MKLINADELIDRVGYIEDDYGHINEEINNMPTIEAEPVRHGKWIKDGEASSLYKCSKCGTLCSLVGYANCIPIEQMNKTMKYCNSCGAKMDEVNDEKPL